MKKLWKDARGSVAITFALATPVLIIVAGLAIDYAAWSGQARKLQTIADFAALSAAKEMHMADADPNRIISVATDLAQAQMTLDSGISDAPLGVAVQIVNNGEGVEVVVSQGRNGYFSRAVMSELAPLSARAIAHVMGGGKVCVIALTANASAALNLTQEGRIEAPTCSVNSNSTSSSGIDVRDEANITAELICSAGGANGTATAYTPSATTDCPEIPDPLIGRAPPPIGGCDYDNFSLVNEPGDPTRILHPGVYCGGLSISGGVVVLEPGVYIIKDGGLRVTSGAIFYGVYVGFYFTGDDATFLFESDTFVELMAPKEGPMAGILLFEDRDAPLGRTHSITSNRAQVLLGTLYISRGELVIDANDRVAQNSAWTAVIARRLSVTARATLVLNSEYGPMDIPLPAGINRVGSAVVLQQ